MRFEMGERQLGSLREVVEFAMVVVKPSREFSPHRMTARNSEQRERQR